GTAPDREVGLERRLLAVAPNDGVGEVVERGSEIVDRVTQDQSDRVGDARVGENPTAVARAIRIVLADCGLWFSLFGTPRVHARDRRCACRPIRASARGCRGDSRLGAILIPWRRLNQTS